MDAIAAALLLGVLVLDTTSHLALKAAADRTADVEGVPYILRLLTVPAFWLGIGSFALQFLCWLGFMARVPLGEAALAGTITIVGVMIGGRLLYREHITPPRLLAIGLITCGVALVGWGKL